jgi:FtsP/CotA-like multicopper oxidase with cupredoxin domain
MTNAHDGVVAITQCPVAPGNTITYRWVAEQYGTSWYHSHFALQPWDGVFGPIVIHGPASAKYDEDLGVVAVGDWYHQTMHELYPSAVKGTIPIAPNGLINGMNKFNGGGQYFEHKTKLVQGRKYRMRLVNHAMDMGFKVVLDGHDFQVIATDFVPVTPFDAKVLHIGIGQRLDVVFEAKAEKDNYWLHAVPRCPGGTRNVLTGIKAIFRYDGAPTGDPTAGEPNIGDNGAFDCFDYPTGMIKPVVALEAGGGDRSETFNPAINLTDFTWHLGPRSFMTKWDNPMTEQVLDGKTEFSDEQTVVKLDESRKWVYFIINSNGIGTHPIHLHGHDFWILSQGAGIYDSNTMPVVTKDAPRRDVAMLPNNGHLVIGFPTDNPGVWVMHCHIGWHASLGFALQLVERISEIKDTADMNKDWLNEQCGPWKEFATKQGIVQDDSGI